MPGRCVMIDDVKWRCGVVELWSCDDLVLMMRGAYVVMLSCMRNLCMRRCA